MLFTRKHMKVKPDLWSFTILLVVSIPSQLQLQRNAYRMKIHSKVLRWSLICLSNQFLPQDDLQCQWCVATNVFVETPLGKERLHRFSPLLCAYCCHCVTHPTPVRLTNFLCGHCRPNVSNPVSHVMLAFFPQHPLFGEGGPQMDQRLGVAPGSGAPLPATCWCGFALHCLCWCRAPSHL